MNIKIVIFKLLGTSLLILSLLVGWLLFDFRNFLNTPLQIPPAGETVQIKPGASVRKIAQELHKRALLQHPTYFVWLARIKGYAHRIKAGEYLIPPGSTAEDVFEQWVAGEVVLHALTVIEGWTFKQMLQAIHASPVITPLLQDSTHPEIMDRLGLSGQHPEGLFLPETYHFPRGITDIEFLHRAYQAMQSVLTREWENRDTQVKLKTPYEALILASIIEKETGMSNERGKISGVFNRRLSRGMKLQTDPTVIYGMGASYDGDIRSKDLRTDTPYNTYTRYGLPPTPIAMPSAEAVYAALHPEPGESLYFVARGDGSHVFSNTLAEHNKAVKAYLTSLKRKQ